MNINVFNIQLSEKTYKTGFQVNEYPKNTMR